MAQLSDNMKLYLKKGQFTISRGIQQWGETTVSVAPAGLSTQNTFFGGAGGEAGDHAMSVCGFVDWSNASVNIQTQNVYQGGTVTTSIFWWAYIIEFLS